MSAMTAPGGGILRIGYDQARFEQAINEVLIEPVDLSETAAVVAEDKEKLAGPIVKVEVKKDDVALVVSAAAKGTSLDLRSSHRLLAQVKELELSTKEAEAALRKAGGDLAKALWELTAPKPVQAFKEGPGGRPAIGVGAEL